MYEDWSAGRITEYNFNMLSEKYQNEQKELETKIRQLHETMEAAVQTAADAEKWIALMKQYVNPVELTAELLNTLIEKITVHEAVKGEDGSREQEVEIYYRFIGKRETGLSYPDVTLLEPLAGVFGLGVEELVACEKKEEGEPVKAVLEISRENQQTERKRGNLRMILSALAMLGIALAVIWCLNTYLNLYVSEHRQGAIYMKETEGDAKYLYVEREGHLLRLKCGAGVDFDSIALTDENGHDLVYCLDCRWNQKTYEGTVNACEETGIMFSMSELFSRGGLVDFFFEEQSVKSLFGEPLVYYTCENYFPDPNGEPGNRVYLCDCRFWIGRWWDAEAGVWRNEADNQILRIERCMAATVADVDSDGELEVIARTRWPEKPYEVYDWNGEEIVHLWRDDVPEEIRKDLRCIWENLES